MATTTFKNDMRITGNLRVDGLTTQISPMTAGTGITTGTGTVYGTMVERSGSLVETKILIDLTGLNGGGTAGDIIGVNSAANCHIGQITAANGTVFAGTLRCLELPAGGNVDIDLFSATEATGAEDAPIGDLTETQLCNSGNLTLGAVIVLTAFPAVGQYLYLTNGTATAATYTAGVLEITLYGRL